MSRLKTTGAEYRGKDQKMTGVTGRGEHSRRNGEENLFLYLIFYGVCWGNKKLRPKRICHSSI